MQSTTEQRNLNSIDIDLKSTSEIVRIFHEEDKKAVAAVEAESDAIADAIDLCVAAFQSGGRLFYVGAGTSGRLGVLDASECPPTFSTPPEMVQGIIAGGDVALRRSVEGEEDKPERGAEAIREQQLTPQDILVGIASSGQTPYVIGALKEAHAIGATTIFLCCVPPPVHLKAWVTHFIAPIVGPEIITGSTRLKAGTATKLVLNMLTTAAMIKLGKVYNNLMVDVHASNTKLVARSIRIVQAVTGVDPAAAEAALAQANGQAKLAIVMLAKGLNPTDASTLLEKHSGFLRQVLD
ncbi:N-acetylmuramic acid 6-phosphate etherase [Candidatus Poribacteria bacterium]|nr:N-acetylmuramic acid 6-phosphate etherase [Candidatus Poribacteria bacterium]MYH82400.1 N-acetylmuramic acid 6-phosphate etherase [Candidatus Poribacteria bacterium]MYK95759.1 N-acetylmuramic acid 6-phosphate etherase [Candidatus Poribacteria bacterium]